MNLEIQAARAFAAALDWRYSPIFSRQLALAGLFMLAACLEAGPYAPAAGKPGSEAVAASDPAIAAWAEDYTGYSPGEDLSDAWQNPEKALGPAEASESNTGMDVVSLGNGGSIVLTFGNGFGDGPGWDLAIFENSFSDTFLELAFVEVSSDGENYFRFPNDSLTPAPVGAFGSIDTTHVSGLAGKYRKGFGTPFDLAELADKARLDISQVRYVRIVDIAGGGSDFDTSGDPIYDPFRTVASAGFDLDAAAVRYPAPAHPVLAYFPGASALAGGWFRSGWFGVFHGGAFPWIWHNRHGWLYCAGAGGNSLWLYDSALDWLWTSPAAYPFLWRASSGEWLWFYTGSKNPRWFYLPGTGRLQPVP